MITARMMKIADRMRVENGFYPYTVHTDMRAYVKSDVKFFSRELCQTCKEKLNLNKDRFIKEK